MALKIRTSNPNNLLSKIKKAMDEGSVVTWSYDKDGDFTHTPTQWKNRAWLRPEIRDGEIFLSVLRPEDVATVSDEVYAVYHGRFSEMMLAHFRNDFRESVATP